MNKVTSGTLDGLKVVDMGHVASIPATGALMADWGADVIKIEPISGEMLRGLRKTLVADTLVKYEGGEVNWQFELHNRGKKSIALNLKTGSGTEIAHRLVEKTDVFMSNYEVNALQKMKMDYLTLSKLNPRLVYALLTGYGTAGPLSNERGFDQVAWGLSGVLEMITESGRPLAMLRPAMADWIAGSHAVAGILAALFYRQQTGLGQNIELSLYHSAVWTNANDTQCALMGRYMPKYDRTKTLNPLTNAYLTGDRRWLMLAMLQSDLHWSDFCRAIGRPELENDQKFNDSNLREQHAIELTSILDDVFRSNDIDYWEKQLRQNNCICSRAQTTTEAVLDPQALANGFFEEVPHPIAGKMKYVAAPVKFSQSPAKVRGPAPEVGQQTEEILLELGYGWDDINRLKDEKTIL